MSIKISKRSIIFMVLFLPFVKLAGMSEIGIISKLFDALFIIASAVIIYQAVMSKYKMSSVVLVNFVLHMYLLIVTFMKGNVDTSIIRNTFGTAISLVLVDYWLKRNPRIVCNVMMWVFAAYSVLNLVCGNGKVFDTYLYGQRTMLTCVGFPMIIIALFILEAEKEKKYKRKYLILFAIITLTNMLLIIKESVSTTILSLAIFVLAYIAIRYTVLKKITAKVYVVMMIFYNFVITIFQSFGYMQYIFENILGESMTMTGRLTIWNNSYESFAKSPIWGYGFRQLIVERGKYATDTRYVHNNYLQFMVDGGLIALIMFIILLMIIFKKQKKVTKTYCILLAGMIAMQVAMISEVLTSYNYFYFALVLMEFFLMQETNVLQQDSCMIERNN